jgi:hypothetical protein
LSVTSALVIAPAAIAPEWLLLTSGRLNAEFATAD